MLRACQKSTIIFVPSHIGYVYSSVSLLNLGILAVKINLIILILKELVSDLVGA